MNRFIVLHNTFKHINPTTVKEANYATYSKIGNQELQISEYKVFAETIVFHCYNLFSQPLHPVLIKLCK